MAKEILGIKCLAELCGSCYSHALIQELLTFTNILSVEGNHETGFS